jgi:murein DD-endopeptidase MepM/ murein hydrolase activator NlpD
MKNSLDVLNEKLAKILGQLKQIEGITGAAGAGGSGSSGVMGGSLSNVTTVAKPFSMGGAAMQMAGTALGTLGAVAAAGSSMMPDFGMTIARRAGFYQAGVASGGMMSHGRLESSVRLGLGQFSTSEGSDSAVAAMLTTRGMVPGSRTFNQTVTGVGQAARYLNMSNEVSASALEGLTSGPTSAMMMRNFGVFTSNPATGQAMGQAQIFSQLADRFTGGRQTTVEGTLESLRRGNLGSNIRNSGLDSAQQAMLSQYMIDRARGINMDLSDPNAISEAIRRNEESGISNPMLEQYRQNSKDNELMERATDSYITGMETASDMLIRLKDSIKDLPDAFYELKGGIDFFMGDKVGSGIVGGATSLVGGLGQLATQGMAMYGGAKMLQGMAGGKGAVPGTIGSNLLPAASGIKAPAVRGMGIAGAVVSTGAAAYNIANGEPVGQNIGRAIGTTAGTILGGIAGSFVTPVAGTVVGGIAAGYAGGELGASIGAMFDSSPSGGSDGSTTIPGPQSKNWSGAYGERRSGGRTHKGIDVALPVGTPLKAVMDGVVIASGIGSGARSYGEYVQIEHKGGKSTLYAHMSVRLVKIGDRVVKGQIIGLSGNTGFSTGPHLHFELRVNGAHTNPAAYVGLAYGPGGTKGNPSALDGNDGSISGAGSSAVVPNNFISASWAGVTGGSSNVKDLILSGGSLGSLPTGSVSDIPDSISSGNRSSVMGTQLSKVLRNNSPAIGGGEEPLGASGINSSSSSIGQRISGSSSKPNVTINLTITSASETEARRFANLVKQQLEEDSVLSSMGSK